MILKKQLLSRSTLNFGTPATSEHSDDNNFMEVDSNEDKDVATIDRYMKNLDITEENEPAYITHMKSIVKLVKKHPDVKSDINKTLLEMFTKAKIKPEQYDVLKQEIDTREQPRAMRATRAPNPRAKRTAQSDKVITQMNIDSTIPTTSSLPKGKSKKDNQKKKQKVVVL